MNQLPLSIETLKKELEVAQSELKESLRKQRLVAEELANMIKAQGNLYRFQERIEQQKIIYAQIAQVGNQFNESLEFSTILQGLDRFLIDLLNYERFILLLQNSHHLEPGGVLVPVRWSGFHESPLKESVGKLSWNANSPDWATLLEGKPRWIVPLEEPSELKDKLGMDEFIAHSLGRWGIGLRGILLVGNSQQNSKLHQRINSDGEMMALFENFIALIGGGLNSVHFLDQIQVESEQVKRLLDNMKQGVFSVDAQGLVCAPVSRFTQNIFGESIVGRSVWETLFKDVPQGSEVYTSLQTVFATVYGESSLQWELMEDQLPKRLEYIKAQEGIASPLTLKTIVRPIFDDLENLDKIMFVVEDVTEIEKLEQQVSQDREEIQIIQELANCTPENLSSFFTRSAEQVQSLHQLIEQFPKNGALMGDILRGLHTLKGNSRLFNLSLISKTIHFSEAKVLDLKNAWISQNQPITAVVLGLEQELIQVLKTILRYSSTANRVLNLKNSFSHSLFILIDGVLENTSRLSPELLLQKLTPLWELLPNSHMPRALDQSDSSAQGHSSTLYQMQSLFLETWIKSGAFNLSVVPNDRVGALLSQILTNFPFYVKMADEILKGTQSEVQSPSDSKEVHQPDPSLVKWIENLGTKMRLLVGNADRKFDQPVALIRRIWLESFTSSYLEFAQQFPTPSQKESILKLKIPGCPELSESTGLCQFFQSLSAKAWPSPQLEGLLKQLCGFDLFALTRTSAFKPINWENAMASLLNCQSENQLQIWIQEISESDPVLAELTRQILRTQSENSEVYTRVRNLIGIFNPHSLISKAGEENLGLRTLEVADINLSRLQKAIDRLQSNQDWSMIEDVRRDFQRLQEMPIKTMLLKFSNMIREVSENLGKQVDFRVIGEDVTLDKARVDLLSDALVHILRNAIDHGIETPEERIRAHKTPSGLIEIQCFESREQITINISDDGRGIDPEFVAKAAVKKGLLTNAAANQLTPEQKQQLIFKPGFSTKENATELSGRGVGMDIVNNIVQKCGGQLHLVSRMGLGSEISITLPIR